jgi:hypothetical protein
MCDVYCSMKELRKIDALKKCEQGYESPKWVCLLRESVKKFDAVRAWLTDKMSETFDFTHSDLDERDARKQSWIEKREDTILLFSESILMTKVFFPGPVFCCKHVITDMEHLNVMCNHCRYFQMHISTQRNFRLMTSQICELKDVVYRGHDDLLSRYDSLLMKYADIERKLREIESSRLGDSRSDSDEDDNTPTHQGRASLLVVTQHTRVTRQNNADSSERRNEEVPKPDAPPWSENPENIPTADYRRHNVDDTSSGRYTLLPERERESGSADKAVNNPRPPPFAPTDKVNTEKEKTDSKLEVQNLLRMLQNAAY